MISIRWTPSAAADLAAIHDYIAEDSPTAAEKVVRAIVERIRVLSRFPRRGRAGRVAGTRELSISGSPYIVVYELKERTAVILRVLHGAMRWP